VSDSVGLSQENISTSPELQKVANSIELLDKLIQESKEGSDSEVPLLEQPAADQDSSSISSLLDSMPSEKKSLLDSLPEIDPNSDGSKDILYRIELLRKIKKRQDALADAAMQASNPLRGNREPNSTPKESIPAETISPIDLIPPMTVPAEEELPTRPVPPPITGTKVLPSPVDAFEMGNSLFQAGRVSTALEAYEATEIDKMTVFDASWLRLMKANCHRQLGNIEEAERIYREISNERNSIYLSKSSKWWLDQSKRIKNSKASFERLNLDIESIDQRLKNQ
jgi:tetratricopeptide (TPR) repeat protein